MVTAEFMSEYMPLPFLDLKPVSEVLLDMCDDVGFVRVTLSVSSLCFCLLLVLVSLELAM